MEKTKVNKKVAVKKTSFFLFCVLSGFLLQGSAHAEGLGKNMATVNGKAPNCIMIADYQFRIASNYVLVTSSASILDVDGTVISLKSLKIPCTAKLLLRQKKNRPDPELIRLEVQEYAPKRSIAVRINNFLMIIGFEVRL